MAIQILGKQRPDRKKPINMAARLGQTTRDIMKAENLLKSQGGKVSKKVKYLVLFFFIKLLLIHQFQIPILTLFCTKVCGAETFGDKWNIFNLEKKMYFRIFFFFDKCIRVKPNFSRSN